MPNWEAYEEASKRGILPEDEAALYEEAKRRGLVPGFERSEPSQQPNLLQSVGPEREMPWYEQAGRSGIEQLPLAGMMLGGGGGAGLGALAGGLGAIPGGIIGSMLGGGAGEWGKQKIKTAMGWQEEKPIFDFYYDIGKEAVSSGLAEIGGGVVGKGLELGLKAAPKVTGAAREMIQKGFPITRGTMIEKAAEKIPPGSWFFKKWRGKLNEMVNESNKQFVTEELGLPSPQLKFKAQEMKKEAWNKLAEVAGGKDVPVEAPNILKWIDSNIESIPKSEKWLLDDLENIRKQLGQKGTVEFKDLSTLPSTLWGKNYNKLSPTLKKNLGELRQALGDDLKYIQDTTGKNVSDAFDAAMETAKLGHRIRGSQFIEDMIRKSTKYDVERELPIFQPARFKAEVENNLGRLQKEFEKNPEIVDMIQAYADKMMLAGRDLARFAQEKPTSLLEKVGVGAGGLAGIKTGVLTNPGLAVPWGFETAMAHSLSHPRGWLKKFLFREGAGITPEIFKQATKAGLMEFQPLIPQEAGQ